MMRTVLVTLVLLVCGVVSAGPIAGDLKSHDNDLSYMISVSGSWDGTNPDLGMRDDLPYSIRATVDFKRGTFHAGTYEGWLHGPEVDRNGKVIKTGDEVYYEVESRDACGEWRRVVKAGRCGNPASGRYRYKYPVVAPLIRITTKVVRCVIPPPPPLEETPLPPALLLDRPELDLQVITGSVATVCAQPCQQVGSFVLGRAGERHETLIGGVGWSFGGSTCQPKPGCPPGTAPAPPPRRF